jgi:hypothetical protein
VWRRLNSNSPKWHWRQLMVEKLTFNSLATALVDIPTVSMPTARSLKTRHLWHYVVWQNCTFSSGLLLSPAQGAPV